MLDIWGVGKTLGKPTNIGGDQDKCQKMGGGREREHRSILHLKSGKHEISMRKLG